MDQLVIQVMAFLVAAVIAPPLFKRLGFGSAVGYLGAGILIGPSGIAIFNNADAVLGFAQLGIVLLLFVIGLDTRLSRLVALQRDILGLGLGQVALTTAALAGIGIALGASPAAAIVIGFAFALSGTAVALQMLEERGDLPTAYGQRGFAVLLSQDLLTVPILALIPIAFAGASTAASATGHPALDAALAVGVIAAIILTGRYLLDPLFKLLAESGTREVMTSAALLVVFGAALAASLAGLSMALGAFLAGVMLANSSYRHQVQADVEPFRGLLLALFFMSIGMMIDLAAVAGQAALVFGALAVYIVLKIALAFAVARLTGSGSFDALRIGLLLAAAGEFAFVLVPLALDIGLVGGEIASLLIAIAALSMILSPPLAALAERLRPSQAGTETMDEDFAGAKGSVLVIGFGRFGQIASQMLLSQGCATTLIDNRPNRIEAARRFGFKVYFGDGRRLDVLRAAGIETMSLVLVAIDDPNESMRICELLRSEFPFLKLHVRAYDRAHAIALMGIGVDHIVRDTFESAILSGREVLIALGASPARAAAVEEDVRSRDLARLELQRVKGIEGGIDLLHQTAMQPEPLRPPQREAQVLNAPAPER